MEKKRVLKLVLKRKWFELIEQGIKGEEYRDITDYWEKRLMNKEYDIVTFYLGYSKNRPQMSFFIDLITKGYGEEEWGAEVDKCYYIIVLGKRIN